ncbi:TPA: hypothetical protein ACFP3Z_000512 [Neisseria subflava]|uniref:hypothetical protein n=1 Tax=Neisseria sp. 27098_8_112 TaxID=3003682 RepID=UPI00352DC2D1
MLKKSVYFILSLSIILFLILIILFFLSQASIWVKKNNTVAIPIITAIIGLIGVMWTQWQSKSRDIAESHRNSKIETYSLFFDIIEKFQRSIKNDQEIDILSDVDLQAKFEKLNRGFILWASDEVIQTWIEFRKNSSENTLDKIDNVYRAIRKDLGHKDKKLKNLDLIRINLSNPNEL